MKKIILISGKAEHGKTTAANMLKDKLTQAGYKVVITRYAYYLKSLATNYCNWNGLKDEEGRQLLQALGTDIIRNKLNKPLFHVQRICEDVEICKDYFDYVIIDDLRFKNEFYYSKAIFGDDLIAIRVNRLDYDGNGNHIEYQSKLTLEQKRHISEVDLDGFKGFDYNIYTTDLNSLELGVNSILNKENMIEK